MRVKELYLDAITYEESSLAHYISHLLAERKITLEDDVSQLDLSQADHQKAAAMIQNNTLGFHKIGIYSLKKNAQDFIFIFAGSAQEATDCFTRTFHQNPINCHEYSLDFELSRGKGVISFREMRKEFEGFPAVAGVYQKRE